jgi:hypothetical protein
MSIRNDRHKQAGIFLKYKTIGKTKANKEVT